MTGIHPNSGLKEISHDEYESIRRRHMPHERYGAVYYGLKGPGFKGQQHVSYDYENKEHHQQIYSHPQWDIPIIHKVTPDKSTGKPPRYYKK